MGQWDLRLGRPADLYVRARRSGVARPRKEAVSQLDREPVTVGDHMTSYHRNHYVPKCQKSFFPSGISVEDFLWQCGFDGQESRRVLREL